MQIFERKITKAVNYDTFKVLTPIWGSRSIKVADFNSFHRGKKILQKFEGKKVEIIPISKSNKKIVAKIFYNEEELPREYNSPKVCPKCKSPY